MYVSILDTWDTTRTMYDTVKCSTSYKGAEAQASQTEEQKKKSWIIEDYVSDKLFYEDITATGNFISSVTKYKDTEN